MPTVASATLLIIYLDNNATTRPSAAAAAAAARGMTDFWENPSSVHRAGQAARAQVELARESIASLIGGRAREITFTSGGTESIDLAIRGIAGAGVRREPPRVISTRIEHAAVRDALDDLRKRGLIESVDAPLGPDGIVDAAGLAGLLTPNTALVSVQWANNETGAIQPVREIHRLCREHGVLFHCDGVQWIGKEPVDAGDHRHESPAPPPCDLLSLSAHKFHGPKGVGVLWVRSGVRLRPTLLGSQELGRRGGTENVPGIMAAGEAAREAAAWLADTGPRQSARVLRDRLESRILHLCPGAVVNGPQEPTLRLWNTTNIGFPRLEAEALLLLLSERGVCASAGAACSSGSLEPSPVLLAMGIDPAIAHGSIRLSLSKETTQAQVDEAALIISECVNRLRTSMPNA